MSRTVYPRGVGKFRIIRPKMRRPPVAPITRRFVEPSPVMSPEDAEEVRNALRGLSGYELERLDRDAKGGVAKSILERQAR